MLRDAKRKGGGGNASITVNQHQAKATRRRCSGPPKIRPPASNLAKRQKKTMSKARRRSTRERGRGREEGGRKGQWKKKRSSRMKANVLAKRKVGFNGCGLGGD